MQSRIAILAADGARAARITTLLEPAAFDCAVFHEEDSLRHELRIDAFDLVIIDASLPGADATMLRAAARHRRSHLSVIRVMADPGCHAILEALEDGAHDCIVEPLRGAELMARANALVRRGSAVRTSIGPLETHGGFAFDATLHAVRIDSSQVRLTTKEFQLARLLFRNLSRPVSRDQILKAVWREEQDSASRTVDTHVSRVRTKLGLRPAAGYRLSPLYGFGYLLQRVNKVR